MASSHVLALALALVLVVVATNADAAAIDTDGADLTDEDLREYLALLEEYMSMHQGARNKRAPFCLARDMSCPNLEGGKDFCCKGSQCSCNLFGQNCKCSTVGIFQRLG